MLIAESIGKIKLKADNMNGKVDVKISVSPICPVKSDDLNATTSTVSKIILVAIKMFQELNYLLSKAYMFKFTI